MSAQDVKREAEIVQTGSQALEGGPLLGFYDRVRGRIEAYLERRAGRAGAKVAAALLLVPDVLLLLVRLFLDRDVPRASRTLIGGALAYFLLPADLAPEIVLGPVGFLDDLVIACTVLAHAVGPDLEVWAERYWSGSKGLREVLTEITQAGNSLLGTRMSQRVDRVLQRRLLKQGQG
jgi:uncharacterized membrane protein YkvA (DUF1232 family)